MKYLLTLLLSMIASFANAIEREDLIELTAMTAMCIHTYANDNNQVGYASMIPIRDWLMPMIDVEVVNQASIKYEQAMQYPHNDRVNFCNEFTKQFYKEI